MFVKLVFCVILAVAAVVQGKSVVEEKFHSKRLEIKSQTPSTELHRGTFTTRLDHFRAQDNRTLEFVYHANLGNHIPGAPIYIYIKDGGDYSTEFIERGLMVDIANETNGALFTFDQRYLGENIPTETASFDDLAYLSPEQVLADIATFIHALRVEFRGDEYSRVIIWGSGYGGTLAAWARKKYPHLIDAAWSSSGVFEIHVDTLRLYDTLAHTLHGNTDFDCRDIVKAAFTAMDDLVEKGDGATLQQKLNLCHPVNTSNVNDVAALFQRHLDYIIQYIELHHQRGVRDICNDLHVPANDPLAALGRWVNFVQRETNCRDVTYRTLIDTHSQTSWNSTTAKSGRRQMYYLQCTQTGLFQITDSVSWLPNRIPLSFHQQECQDVLGEKYNFNLLNITNEGLRTAFGSLDQRVTSIIYTNGDIDPWYYHGIVYTHDHNSIVLNIDYHAHSADLTSIRGFDPMVLFEIKQEIKALIIKLSTE